MKSIVPGPRRTDINNTHYTSRRFKSVFLVVAFLMLGTVMAVPFDFIDSSSRGSAAGEALVQRNHTGWASTLSLPSMAGESVTLYAADCATPRSSFNLGEVVCAKTDGVDLSVANNHFINWIDSQVNSTNGGTITQNPQFFLFTPPTADTWKATIGRVAPPDSSIIGLPPIFTVEAGVGIATYAADCTTSKTTFTLGDTVCVKVSGASPADNRRIGWVDPAGITRTFTPIITDPQTDSFTLPTTETSTIDVFVVDNRGRWNVNVVSGDGSIVRGQQFLVQGNEATADLSVSKSLVGEVPETGQSLTFLVAVTNNGPNPAENVVLTDEEPDNATFVSVTQTSGPAFSCTSVAPVVCTRGTTASPLFLNPGETAVFELVYTASGATGSSITNVASAESETEELEEFDNTAVYTLIIGGGAGTPAECVLNCPPSLTVATNTTQSGNPGATVTFGDPVANGNCGTVTASPASGSFFPVGTTTVTVTSSVGGGSCSFAVTVIDSPSPTITCPANQTVAAPSGQAEATVSVGTPSTTGDEVVIGSERSDERAVTDPYPIGTTTITWSATDQFGRQAFCVQTIVVTSNDTPTISCPSNKTFNSTNGCEYTATAAEIGTPTTTGLASPPGEACPVSNPCAVRSDGLALTDPFPAGQTTITWTATNAVGSASCTQIITVIGNDTTAPTLHVPANIVTSTNQCSILLDDEQFGATAEDDGTCGSSVTISRTGIPRVACPVPGDPNRTCESFVFPTGTTIVTYTATDASGNSTSGTQTVTVNENPNIPPTIDAPQNLTVFTGPGATSCGTFVSDATLGTATANDNCAGVVVTRTGIPAGNVFPVGTTTVTYRATDRVGNFVEDTQTVTVIDNTPPVVTPPPNITVFLPLNTTDVSMVVNYPNPATATDNCPGTLNITYSPASGSVFPVGTTTVTASTTDAHGNTGSATFTVTVLYNFTGFFQPVDNLPTLNVVNAGKGVPVKFSLSGNKGLNIFAVNSPFSISINCDGSLPQSDIEETVNAGGSSLTYDASTDTYNYVWKTENQWKNTCRQLVVILNDGSEHRANFKFK
ncbi:MAG TPA: PxKF domain-containing protein [Pyrinomonadaceae bacterium]|nr:PxKF domain-containing protein [Pyrinomonadaceae bacterium]